MAPIHWREHLSLQKPNLAEARRLVERVRSGVPMIVVADEFGVTRDTVAGWLHRWELYGETALREELVTVSEA